MSGCTLAPIFGDQLSRHSPLLDLLDPSRDVIVMGEVEDEIRRHPNHRQRVILFLSAMRHFRDELRERGFRVDYQEVDAPDARQSLAELIRKGIEDHQPDQVALLEPGRYELQKAIEQQAADAEIDCRVLDDPHFLLTRNGFAAWAQGRKTLVLEHFYRMMRKKTGYLMDGDEPAGGKWNFDRENRNSFGADGPDRIPQILRFEPDRLTRDVIDSVDRASGDLPGRSEPFAWPVTPDQAREALADFVQNRLAGFGAVQDAMWTGQTFLNHSGLSAAMNLRMLDPREALDAVENAYRQGRVPVNSAEGFVRQVLGWREFMRGLYWTHMPGFEESNGLGAHQELPEFFWTGETSMACLADVIDQLLRTGYAHHIQRLMVSGLFCLLYGVDPKEVHDWFMAMYVDSVEWVTMPNTIGMSQYADGGTTATKPYIASGKYINRMSNYCSGCRFDPDAASGADACPFTTLYWDFISRHERLLEENRRTIFQVRNFQRKSGGEKAAITRRANELRSLLAADKPL